MPGRTLAYIDHLTDGRPLARLIGGTHLVDADEARVALVAAELARRDPDLLAPCHWTGRTAAGAIRRALPGASTSPGSGTVVE